MVITDASREEVHNYVSHWVIDFQHVLENQNANFWWITISVDPIYISASNVGAAELKTTVQDHVTSVSEYWEGTSVVSFTSSSMTVKIPKNGVYQVANGLTALEYLNLLKSDFSDVFKTTINFSRYHFSEADVDTAIANGGRIEITKAQALNRALDKLEE